MANHIYPTGRDAFANGDVDWVANDIRCCLVTSAYVEADEFLDDVTVVANSKKAASLANKSTSGGVCDADDCTLGSANISGTPIAIVIYVHNASDALAKLIAYIDQVTGLPVTFSGATVNIAWSSGTNKIFKI